MDISIIGTGNVSFHLAKAINKAKGINLVSITGTTLEKARSIKGKKKLIRLDSISEIPKSDIVIICVGDDKIAEVSDEIFRSKILQNSIICHTSGSISSKILKNHKKFGSFYPLQTFSKNNPLNFSKVPISLHANKRSVLKHLMQLAEAISQDVRLLNDADRLQVHLSAVISNNLVNHLIYLAKQRLTDQNINEDILDPLIKETINKLKIMSSFDAQTGPARRNDKATLSTHIKDLAKEPELQKVYKTITKSIIKTYKLES